MPTTIEPLINGHRYSFASIELKANGAIFLGVVSISYGSSLKPGIVRGSDGEKVGRTPGEADHRCSIEMLLSEYHALIDSLGPGFGLIPFDVQVMYAETELYDDKGGAPEGVTTHVIRGVRITDVDLSGEDGIDASTAKLALDPVTIAYGDEDLTIEWRPVALVAPEVLVSGAAFEEAA